jgi:deoxycytidylate deaminase
MLEILHVVDQIPNVVTLHHLIDCVKDIKALKKHQCEHEKKDYNNVFKALSDLSDVKKVVRLKRQIQRTGLVLARHAEENALEEYHSNIGIRGRKAIARRKLHVVVIRINNNNEITESKPCSHCVDVMRSYGIRKVTYSTKKGDLVTESLNIIVTQPSVGYRSVERAINILDEMAAFYSTGIG